MTGRHLSLLATFAAFVVSCSTSTAAPTTTVAPAETTTSSTTITSTTTVDTNAQDRAEIEELILAYYEYIGPGLLERGSEGLDQFLAGSYLELVSDQVESLVAHDPPLVSNGGPRDESLESIDVRGNMATATLCTLDGANFVDDLGNIYGEVTPDPYVVVFELERTDEGWRITGWPASDSPEPCDL